jgi:zinc protease
MDDPSKISVSAPLKSGESPEQAVRRLEDFVEETLRKELKEGEAQMVRQMFGFILGMTDVPEAMLAMNPYGVAMVLGRSRQMGLEPAKLKGSLQGLKDEDLRRAAKETFAPDRRGAAVVTVKE